MRRRTLHFQPTLDVDKLRLAAASFFGCDPASVFVYFDAVEIWGSDSRDPDPVQKAAFDAAARRILVRRYESESGPIEGWLSLDAEEDAFEDGRLAAALAAGTGVTFYYVDPVPDPDDEPGEHAAQLEVTPEGVTRHVWLSEFNDGADTQTIVSGRGEDEGDEEEEKED